jgi:hypothetical protein
MDLTKGVAVDFSGHEPVLHIEDEGLDIRGYEIDGEFVLDFDWDPEGKWSFLEVEEDFMAFVVKWLEEMTGQALEPAEIEQLQLLRGSGQDQAADEESKESATTEEAA